MTLASGECFKTRSTAIVPVDTEAIATSKGNACDGDARVSGSDDRGGRGHGRGRGRGREHVREHGSWQERGSDRNRGASSDKTKKQPDVRILRTQVAVKAKLRNRNTSKLDYQQ